MFVWQDGNRSVGKVVNYKLDLSNSNAAFIQRINGNNPLTNSPLASPVAVHNLPGHKLSSQIKTTVNKK